MTKSNIIEKSKISYMGLNVLYKEIKQLGWKLWILLGTLAVIFSLDTLILNYGVSDGQTFKWLWQTTYKQEEWHVHSQSFYHYWYISKITNGATAFVGVLNVVLIAKRKISNYFWGILSTIFYGNYAFSAGYTGDAILNILFYLPMSFVGFHLWSKHIDNEENVIVNRFKLWHWGALITSLAVTTVAWYYLIPVIDTNLRIWLFNDHNGYYFATEFWAHFFDAFTNALGVASTFLMYGRFGQEFYLYAIKDAIGIIMWSGIFHTAIIGFDLSMIINSGAYLAIAIIGIISWKMYIVKNNGI